ncbi:MAG: PAQR family membrane homeostasis protein TrhA [Acidimicrobiales bacterium]
MTSAPPGVIRLSGTESAPRWRGRLLLGALVASVPAATALAWRDQSPAISLYATALVGLFAVSAAYHLLSLSPVQRRTMRQVDHAMIYAYMAAAYTPFCLRAVGGTLGWVVLSLAWAGCAVGIGIKAFRFRRTRAVAGALYMLLGWLAVVTVPTVVRNLDLQELVLLCVMGSFYTGGAVALATRRPDPAPSVFGYHEVWHACVVLACLCYFMAVWGLPGGH